MITLKKERSMPLPTREQLEAEFRRAWEKLGARWKRTKEQPLAAFLFLSVSAAAVGGIVSCEKTTGLPVTSHIEHFWRATAMPMWKYTTEPDYPTPGNPTEPVELPPVVAEK